MRNDLLIAVRLARGGSTIRRWGPGAAAFIASWILLVALCLPSALIREQATDTQTSILVSVLAFVVLPVYSLVTIASRFSSATRERRLAGLRLLGASIGVTRRLAALEAFLLFLGGSTVGALWGALTLGPTSGVLRGFDLISRPLVLDLRAIPLAAGAVLALAVVVSLVPGRGVARSPLSARRRTTATLSAWRLAPLVVGCLIAVAELALNPDKGASAVVFTIAVGGIVLAAIGLLLSLPLFTRLLAGLVVGSSRPPIRLGGRRLEADPVSTSRVVAGAAMAMLLGSAAVCTVGAMQESSTYLRQKHAIESGPQVHRMYVTDSGTDSGAGNAAADAPALAAVPGVRRVIAQYDLQACDQDDPSRCGQVFVGTCADLGLITTTGLAGCSDTRAAWIETDAQTPATGETKASSAVLQPSDGGRATSVSVAPTRITTRAAATDDASPYVFFLPAATAERLGAVRAPLLFFVISDGGYAVRSALSARFPDAIGLAPLTTYEQVRTWVLVIGALLVIVLGVSLISLAVAAIDRIVEQRREQGFLLALGFPTSMLRAALGMQSLLPALIGSGIAIPVGYLAARVFTRDVVDIPDLAVRPMAELFVAYLASVLITVAIAMLGLRSRITPDLLRRE